MSSFLNAEAELSRYSTTEENLNIASHAIGFALSIVALVALLEHAISLGDVKHTISFSIYGLSLVLLYGSSTVYHSSKDPYRRGRLRILDHASIYVLIAGTYTPFTLITLPTTIGWVILSASWGMALIGIVLKFFFTGRYRLFSTLMYVFMGWLIVFAIGPLLQNFPAAGLGWLVAGGLSYTLGAGLYSIKKIQFNHAIFHLFILAGGSCHFVAVYFYID